MKLLFAFRRVIVTVLFLLVAERSIAQTFVNPIPIPYLMTGDTFNLRVDTATHNFNPNSPGDSVNAPLRALCYNETASTGMTYLGPTMVWRKGHTIQVNVSNRLYARTTVHWHGLNLPAETDGGPHEIIESKGTWNPTIPLIDAVQTAWYHTHLMDSTTLQVIQGLAGMLIVEDPENDNVRELLPHDYGMNDFPVVIQEKGFNFTNHVATSIDTGINGNVHLPGNGEYTLINGVMYGVLRVPKEFVRLRMLNGSPRKSFQVGITPVLKNPASASFETMWLVGTDGGYTAQPHGMDSALISPGERMEFLLDATGFGHGDTLYLSNLVRSIPKDIVTGTGAGNPVKPTPQTPGDAFLAIVIDTTIHPADPIMSRPGSLVTYSVDTTGIFKRRTKNLMNMKGGSGSGGMWTIDGTGMEMGVINDTLLVNTKEMWTINNMTNVAHPFHIHKVQFQVVEVEDSLGNKMTYPNLPPYLMGYKDDVLVRAGGKVTFVARFDSFPSMFDSMNAFMYHCHILPHEDNMMMHQFVVVDMHTWDSLTAVRKLVRPDPFTMYPNPTSEYLYLDGSLSQSGTLRFVDLLGRELKEISIPAFKGKMPIDVQDLPRGMVIVEWSAGGVSGSRKVLLE